VAASVTKYFGEPDLPDMTASRAFHELLTR